VNSSVEFFSLPGHDRECAAAILNQARGRRTPLDDIQVEHLLRIGFTAGKAAARREANQRFAFEWRRPRLTVYRAADPRRLHLVLNRYPGVVIGLCLQVRHTAFSLTWGAPGRLIERTTTSA
jgi:hypothetical protein